MSDGNKKYKDSVFTLLFGKKDKLAELYNAISGAKYTPDMIEINTLQDVLYLDRINDVSFTAGNKFVILIEHQALSEKSDNDCYPERIGHREKGHNADKMAI